MESSPELLFEIPRGLEQSILLAVLIGFLVTLLLVESFGWVFVGVVVPGYLASVLVIQPPAALAVVLDASLTYIVAKILETILGRGGASSEFFGRERFFLLVLVSVFVRQHTQTWLWPLALETMDPIVDIPVDFARSFSSIGIVLVPLMEVAGAGLVVRDEPVKRWLEALPAGQRTVLRRWDERLVEPPVG